MFREEEPKSTPIVGPTFAANLRSVNCRSRQDLPTDMLPTMIKRMAYLAGPSAGLTMVGRALAAFALGIWEGMGVAIGTAIGTAMGTGVGIGVGVAGTLVPAGTEGEIDAMGAVDCIGGRETTGFTNTFWGVATCYMIRQFNPTFHLGRNKRLAIYSKEDLVSIL